MRTPCILPRSTHFIVSVSGFISVLFPDVINFLSNFMEQAIISKEHMDFFEDTTKAAIAERTIEDSVSRLIEPRREKTNNLDFDQV